MASKPCMLNSSVHAASTAASTTGMYSGLQPAITALIATFSTVHSTRSGGTIATTSSGSRVVPASIRSTRSGVGGTTRQAVGPAPCRTCLDLVLGVAELDPARAGGGRRRQRRSGRAAMSGSTVRRAATGPVLGQPGPERRPARELFPFGRSPPDGARRPRRPPRRGSASAPSRCSSANDTSSSVSSIDASAPSGNVGSSCE